MSTEARICHYLVSVMALVVGIGIFWESLYRMMEFPEVTVACVFLMFAFIEVAEFHWNRARGGGK